LPWELSPRSQPYIHFMPYAGGWGARQHADGLNAMCPLLNGDNSNVPCEVIEAKFPLLVEQYALIPDSGGPGTFRGGLGVRIDYRLLDGPATVSASLGRCRVRPPGLFGGGDGMLSSLVLNANTPDAENRPIAGGVQVQNGQLISHRCGGGGGFGEPRERNPERVRADVTDGYVSPEAAARDYGVR
jgi:N-methylhydantoinase B